MTNKHFHYCQMVNMGFWVIASLITFTFMCSCSGSPTTQNKQTEDTCVVESIEDISSYSEDETNSVSKLATEYNDYTPEIVSQPTVTVVAPTTSTPSVETNKPQSSVRISRTYQLGYDRGYDDGEDDAVSRNGWQGQYDDSNNFKGQKKKDYELGYCEGYEAGYDDNFEGADD